MANETPTAADRCRQILQARTGWGRNQASAFVAELQPDEIDAIVACGLAPEHATAAKVLFGKLSDRVRRRRQARPKQTRIEPTAP